MRWLLLFLFSLVAAVQCAAATPQFGSIGSPANGTTGLGIPHPSGIQAGDLLVACITSKYPGNDPATPAGWTLLANAQVSGGSGNPGEDSGTVTATVFVRQASGSESGNLAVTITGGNSAQGVMARYTKSAGTYWDYAAASGSDNTTGTTFSVTAGSDPGIEADDLIVVVAVLNGNTTTGHRHTNQALSASGATFGTNSERHDLGTNNGDDCAIMVCDQSATAGTSSGAPTFTSTLGTSVAAGAAVILRIREVQSAPPPEIQDAPVLAGQPMEGLTLTSSTGHWTNEPTSYSYQWQRDTGGGFSNISGATNGTYTLAAADVNATIRCAVTATNAGGSNTVNTTLVGPVWDGPVVGSGYDAIDSLLNPNPNTLDNDHQKVFTVFSPDDDNSVYNPGLWGGGAQVLDLTGIGWKHTAVGGNIHLAAISPNLGITIMHNGGVLTAGHEITFIAADGTRVQRTINARRANVGWHLPVTIPSDKFNIVRFSEDLPATIARYPVLANAEQDFVGTPMLFTSVRPDGGGTPLVRRFRLQQITSFRGTGYNLGVPTDPLRLLYYGSPISGDSGSSRFVLKGAQLIYVSTVAGPADGHSSRQAIGEIRQACRELVDEAHMPTFYEIEKLRATRGQQLRANQ